jgi:hypothetical protein
MTLAFLGATDSVKTYSKLYQNLCSYENLLSIYKKAKMANTYGLRQRIRKQLFSIFLERFINKEK